MMKLLFLIHRLPCPPDGGSKLRAFAQLQYLARRHDVWCAGFLDSSGLPQLRDTVSESLDDLRKCCRGVAAAPLRRPIARARAMASVLARGTATEAYFASRVLNRQVMQWSREVDFDAVLAFSSSMAPLAREVSAKRHVLEMDDLDSRKWAEAANQTRWPTSWMYRTEALRLARREREWIAAFDATLLISEREADLIPDAALRLKVHVIEAGLPTGVGLSDADTRPVSLPTEPIVGFVGAMDYPPNVDGARWFAESIWPQVRARRPDASWWLVGKSPTRAVRRLADGGRVRVTGTVPAVEPYLEQIRVSIAPLRLARGVQMKVLMAMAAGRPCVVTPCVAEGVGAKAGEEVVVADSPAAFADEIVDLLADQRRAEAIGTAGRAFVTNRLGADKGLARLEELLSGGEGPGSRTCRESCLTDPASAERSSACAISATGETALAGGLA